MDFSRPTLFGGGWGNFWHGCWQNGNASSTLLAHAGSSSSLMNHSRCDRSVYWCAHRYTVSIITILTRQFLMLLKTTNAILLSIIDSMITYHEYFMLLSWYRFIVSLNVTIQSYGQGEGLEKLTIRLAGNGFRKKLSNPKLGKYGHIVPILDLFQ